MTGAAGPADAPQGVSAGSRLIAALECAYGCLRADHGELPPVVFTTRSGRKPRSLLWGQHCPGQWTAADGDTVAELFISGECIAQGGAFVWTVITHEAAHVLGSVRGVRNTSGQGNRYHNAAFRKLAEELGAWYPLTEPHPSRGYTDVELTDVTLARYAEPIAALDAALAVSIAAPTTVPVRRSGGDRNGMKFTCECDPPRVLRMAPTVWEQGAPLCPLCESEFA